MNSIFEGQLPRDKAFSNQNMGHLGSGYMYKYNDITVKLLWWIGWRSAFPYPTNSAPNRTFFKAVPQL